MDKNKQVFFPGYITGQQLDYLRQIGTVIETQWDAYHFTPDTLHPNVKVYNGNHCIIIEVNQKGARQ